MEKVVYQPIGVFHCPQAQPVDSPRQGSLAKESRGFLELEKSFAEECLTDLHGFDRVWLVYDLHLNKSWKPMVRPPRGAEKKRGVFATRSPYRPNSIGMSCVRVERIEDRKIFCLEHDLLDYTPILDIKPYIVQADCFPNARQGWLKGIQKFEVSFDPMVAKKLDWLQKVLGKPLRQIITQQLSFEPTNSKIKRVKSKEDFYVFHYRTWKVYFKVNDTSVKVFDLLSNYSFSDLKSQNDLHRDKIVHFQFNDNFSGDSN